MKKRKSPTICKKCGAELSSSAKVCRYCRTKVKKPAYKKWWVWLLVLALLGSCVGKNEEPAEQNTIEESAETVVADDTPIEQDEPEEVPLFVEPEEPEEIEPPVVETPVETPVQEEPVYQEPVEPTVYVTNSGSKYHRDGCKHLNDSKIAISLSSAKARYEPCSNCNP